MKISNTKRSVYEGLVRQQFDSNEDRIIASCLLYDYANNLLMENSEVSNNLTELISSYTVLYKGVVERLRDTFVSYTVMRRRIIDFKVNSFLEMSSSQIDEIIKLYRDKSVLVKFSSTSFSQYMYKVIKLKYHHYMRLSKIHKDVMVPISLFYRENYGIEESALEVYDAEVYQNNPGKAILFAIKGIPSARVVSDIKAENIHINIFDVSLEGQFVKIITN